MKPKPFCPLNHFTVPIAIFFSPKRNAARCPHDPSRGLIQSQQSLGERASSAQSARQGHKSNGHLHATLIVSMQENSCDGTPTTVAPRPCITLQRPQPARLEHVARLFDQR